MELIIIAVIIVLILWVVYTYNSFVQLSNQVQEGWSGIDVQLKRRYNLIPNLVSTVKGYQQHEKGVLDDVTKLRSDAMAAHGANEKGPIETALTAKLGNIIALAENYPDLKASTNFVDLQQQLATIEDQIQLARRYYNGTARDLNTKVESVPANIIANLFKFVRVDYFQLDSEQEKSTPTVDFNAP